MKQVVRPENDLLGHDKGIPGAQRGQQDTSSYSRKPSNQYFCISEAMRSLGESNEDNTGTHESREYYQTC